MKNYKLWTISKIQREKLSRKTLTTDYFASLQFGTTLLRVVSRHT